MSLALMLFMALYSKSCTKKMLIMLNLLINLSISKFIVDVSRYIFDHFQLWAIGQSLKRAVDGEMMIDEHSV